ncbi:glycosyl transferase family group 2-domain-containing protein, partial [Fimicolochytrium jonesii]|uniref:glycosyl transferase family group 2-domain-containing protein n=1 Tax=Fimicolochytrium jonesii TaxID=1396493 RepID=UPI0022FEEDD5
MSSIRNYLATVPWKPIFQRMPGTMLLLVVPFAFLGPIYAPALFAAYYFALHIGFLLNNARSAYGMYVAYTNAKLYSITDWVKKYCQETGTVDGHDTRHDLPYEAVTHVIILPNYKEDMDTLCETLDVLASHSRAVVQYKICLAMEESEQGATAKAATLMQKYANSFFEITYTLHPVGRPGEIRGKSSNVAWAASQMALRSGGGLAGRHDHEILTVMDADTCFAEDFFSAVTYHYTTATPEQRRIMMFAPCTVFDRNSKNVPVFVRVTDMFWSIGVISNLYPSSSIKIPCSAYSVSMDLALAVNFWDAGPEAIGEDMHMYLKCFFATEGRVIVKSIFSPASQCNVEGEGTGIKGYYSYMNARYVQATRHLWGSLDTGYAIRRTLMSFIAPEKETVIPMKNANVSKYGKEEATAGTKLAQRPFLLLELGHRLLESHIMMGHLFTMIIVSALILPIRSCFSYTIATYFWGFLSDDPVHPYVELALNISFWVRMSIVVPNVVMIYYYEKYHQWVGFERWALQDQQMAREGGLLNSRVDSAMDLSADKFSIAPSHSHLRVQPLGKRAQLASERKYPRNLADWFCIPVAGFLFYVVPQFHAQLTQLFTERLDYKVAAKPQL